VYPSNRRPNAALTAFIEWLRQEAQSDTTPA